MLWHIGLRISSLVLMSVVLFGCTDSESPDTTGTQNGFGHSPSSPIVEVPLGKTPSTSPLHPSSAVSDMGASLGHVTTCVKTFIVSPDSRHVAYVSVDDGCHAVVDGVKGKNYPDGISLPLVFSPDGSQLAYSARLGGDTLPVIGGREGNPFGAIATIFFSSDSKHVAFGAIKDQKTHVVIDGKEKTAPIALTEPIYFHPGGKQAAYITLSGGKVELVVNDTVQVPGISPHRRTILLMPGGRIAVGLSGSNFFSPDGKHFGYIAQVGEKKLCAVLDGKAGKPYDFIEGSCLIFSDDGKHAAFCAQNGKKCFMVVDGVNGKEYDNILDFAFSPDGQHYAFAAQLDQEKMIVVDGREGPKHQWVGKDLLFGTMENRLLETDFQVDKDYRFGELFKGKITYSPDGRRLAYGVNDDNNKWYMVVEESKSSPWDDIGNPAFSPNSRHMAYMALQGKKWRLIVDGKEKGPAYDAFPADANVIFDSDTSLHTIAARDGKFYRLEVDLTKE